MARPALQAQSDERLLALARRGSGQAFEAYVRRYRKPLIAYAAKMVGADRAEDVVQQTFIKALDALKTRDGAEPAKPWLYTVTHNLSVNVLKKKANQYDELPEEHVDRVGTEEAVADKQRFAKLVSAINVLPDKERQIVVSREFEERSLEQIAADLDSSPTAVNQMLYRARKKLRDACGALVPIPILLWLLHDRPITAVSTTRVATLVGKPVGRVTALKFAVAALAVGTAAIGGAVFLGGSGNSGGSKGVSDTVAQVIGLEGSTSPSATAPNARGNTRAPSAATPGSIPPSYVPSDGVPTSPSYTPRNPSRSGSGKSPSDGSKRDKPKSKAPSSGLDGETPGSTGGGSAGGSGSSPGTGNSSGNSSGNGSGGGSSDPGGSGDDPPPTWSSPASLLTSVRYFLSAGKPSGPQLFVWMDRTDYSVHAAWQQVSLVSPRAARQAPAGVQVSPADLDSNVGEGPTAAVNSAGVGAVAWGARPVGQNVSKTKIQVSTSANQVFGDPEAVSREGAYSPQLGIDDSGDVIAIWQRGDTARLEVAIRPSGESFGDSERLSDNELLAASSVAKLHVADDGSALIVWQEQANGTTRIKAAAREPGGSEFGAAQTLKQGPAPEMATHIAISSDADGNMRVAWAWWNGNSGYQYATDGKVETAYRPANGSFGPSDQLATGFFDAVELEIVQQSGRGATLSWVEEAVSDGVLRRSLHARRISPSGTLGSPIVLAGPAETVGSRATGVDAHGHPIMVWTSGTALKRAGLDANGEFSQPEAIDGPDFPSSPLGLRLSLTNGRLTLFWIPLDDPYAVWSASLS